MQWYIVMKYSIIDIVEKLKTAREAKGISQRELSLLAGVPQSHISKIERGVVDLRLSSLIELARVLNLELMLVPRKSLPAVNSIVRSNERVFRKNGHNNSSIQKEWKWINETISSLTKGQPENRALAQIQRHARDLQRFQIPDKYLKKIQNVRKALQTTKNEPVNQAAILNTLSEIHYFRNSLAHAPSSIPETEAVRPAYTLDGD
jgi:transcriptional regulator with XRE-family HTH domain